MNKIKLAIATLFSITLLFTSFAPPLHAGDDLLQCVADCIMQEGEAEAETCQMRCANIDLNLNQEPKDCMAVYKQCKKDCDGEKSCKKVCKTALTNCV